MDASSVAFQSRVTLGESNLTIDQVAGAAFFHSPVGVSTNMATRQRLSASQWLVERAVNEGAIIYGITTGFGGMGDVIVNRSDAEHLQRNLLFYHKTGVGHALPEEDVRAAMLLRAHTLCRGFSGVRMAIIERYVACLNLGFTPVVPEHGSIGASGDLVPLNYIAGAVLGQSDSFRVKLNGVNLGAASALKQLCLSPLMLRPKEGLAMINGTSMMTGIAANCVHRARRLLAVAMGAHALALQGLRGSNRFLNPFPHAQKPHPGQIWTANQMRRLLKGSRLMREESTKPGPYNGHGLVQDRYSLRCLPQFFGPIVEGIRAIISQVTTEINSVTDNPLIDPDTGDWHYSGNFLGEHISVAMDHLRSYIGLLAKHLDVQIASLVTPYFSNGLPASLVGNPDRKINMGLKGLQLTANSISPLLLFLGNSLADRFPTHAEQYNQNINSLGFGSANLARQSLDLFEQYLSIALIFGIQALDLRTYGLGGHYDSREYLSPMTAELYTAVRSIVDSPPSRQRPYIFDDEDRPLDTDVERIATQISRRVPIATVLDAIAKSIDDVQ